MRIVNDAINTQISNTAQYTCGMCECVCCILLCAYSHLTNIVLGEMWRWIHCYYRRYSMCVRFGFVFFDYAKTLREATPITLQWNGVLNVVFDIFFSLNGMETIAVAWSECIERNYPSLAVGLCEPQIVFRLSLSIIVCLLFVTCWLNSLVTYTLWLSIENSAIFATWHSSKINELHILQKLCVEHEAWVIE